MEFSAILSLLKLQIGQWETKVRYSLRFIICGITTFLSFSIYELLKGITIEQQNSLLVAAFGEPSLWVIILYLLGLGYAGLYLSILSVALFTSLLPKT
ncbi:MAG: hypothetical protein ABJH28_04365 [Paraglaciecola sp.]|uniref:hypothetical protein n=1 Tax=Paraglaciecola sp. TaxID=1920173 RepID=UPI003265125D